VRNSSLYEVKLVEQLRSDRWLRHLFNKLGKMVVVVLRNGESLIGELKTIEFINGVINLEVRDEERRRTYFINWKYVQYLEYVGELEIGDNIEKKM